MSLFLTEMNIFCFQYIQLLERFEIVLTLDESRYLIPCMLPIEHPSIVNAKMKLKDSNNVQYITRNYHMAYIPAGFWSRLIARIIIAVHKWGTSPATFSEIDTGQQLPSDDGGGGGGGSTLDEYVTIWRNGIIVFYNNGCFLMEQFEDGEIHEGMHNKGVAICIWDQDNDFSTMGFVVDHLDSLISEWYPG